MESDIERIVYDLNDMSTILVLIANDDLNAVGQERIKLLCDSMSIRLEKISSELNEILTPK